MDKRASAKGKTRGKDKGLPFQDPHASPSRRANLLEEAIGREVKGFREKLGLTIAELAKAAMPKRMPNSRAAKAGRIWANPSQRGKSAVRIESAARVTRALT